MSDDNENAIVNYVGSGALVASSGARPYKDKKKNAPRKLASLMERRANQSVYHIGMGKRLSYARAMEAMVFDLVVAGETITSTGETLSVKDVKQWTELVKFVHNHIDGPIFPQQPNNVNVNVVKIYAGVNPEDV